MTTGAARKVIAVTGASGFVGRHLVPFLLLRKHHVSALTRGGEVAEGAQARTISDLNDEAGLVRALVGVDVVVHLAARVHVQRDRVEDPIAQYRQTNVEGTRSVMRAAAKCGVRHVVFLSSVKAVGESTRPDVTLNEIDHPAPVDPYGVSKLEAERVLEETARGGSISVTILRPALVYGPGVGGNLLRILGMIVKGVPIPVGAVKNRRSMIYVGNLVAAIAALAERDERGFRRFFASDGVDLSTPELVRLLGEGVGRAPRIVSVPRKALKMTARLGDLVDRRFLFPWTSAVLDRLTGSLVVQSDALWRSCGIRPPFTPREGLCETGRWYAQHISGVGRT